MLTWTWNRRVFATTRKQIIRLPRSHGQLVLSLVLASIPFAAGPLAGQAITPDPAENHPTKSVCLGTAKVMNDDGIQFETYMRSAVNLSPHAVTATLPLFKGYAGNGSPVYYIVTESSDCKTADRLGINYSEKLGKLIDATGNPVNKSVQQVTIDSAGAVHFAADTDVDFSPVRIFTASTASTPNFFDPVADGPQAFPPSAFAAPSVGGPNYTPLITYTEASGKHIVLNATIVANATGIKKFIPAIDFNKMTVTFNLVHGIYNFHFVMYLRMDASDALISAFEGGNLAPNLNLAPIDGDSSSNSARQHILPIVNGIRGVDKLFGRQGVQSGALLEGDPNNVMGAKPGQDQDYSPLWDITPPVWKPAAVAAGKRQRLHQDDEVASFVMAGDMESWGPAVAMGHPGVPGFAGIVTLNIVSNCPIMLRVLEGLPAFPGGK